jgi:hypothetical protein
MFDRKCKRWTTRAAVPALLCVAAIGFGVDAGVGRLMPKAGVAEFAQFAGFDD